MWRILNNLYLGDEHDARNRFLLDECRITHILNCAAEVRCFFRNDYRYLHLKFDDPDPAFADNIPKICSFIRKGRRTGAVLVHCRMGISRSVSAILGYLLGRGYSLERALQMIQRGVGEGDGFIEPHEVFLDQLRDYYEQDEGDIGPGW